MTEALEQKKEEASLTHEQIDALMKMDINKLTLPQRTEYLWHFAVMRGLDPTLNPFDVIKGQNGMLKIYANAGCADQLRAKHKLSVEKLKEEWIKGPVDVPIPGEKGKYRTETRRVVYKVDVRVTDPDGRFTDESGTIGVVNQTGDTLANSMLKAVTKAQRRATLGHCGLGMPDVTEVDAFSVRAEPEFTEPRQISAPRRPAVDPPTREAEVVRNGNGVPKATLSEPQRAGKPKPPAVPREKL